MCKNSNKTIDNPFPEMDGLNIRMEYKLGEKVDTQTTYEIPAYEPDDGIGELFFNLFIRTLGKW